MREEGPFLRIKERGSSYNGLPFGFAYHLIDD